MIKNHNIVVFVSGVLPGCTRKYLHDRQVIVEELNMIFARKEDGDGSIRRRIMRFCIGKYAAPLIDEHHPRLEEIMATINGLRGHIRLTLAMYEY
jgi:hypothetical protein